MEFSGQTLTTAFLKTDGAEIGQYDRSEILELSDKYLKVESVEGVRLFERIDSASGYYKLNKEWLTFERIE